MRKHPTIGIKTFLVLAAALVGTAVKGQSKPEIELPEIKKKQ